MMGDKKCPECKKGAPEYMNTYGDMMTLLLCFFVLLFAFSSIDSEKFKTMMQAFQGALGIMKGGTTIEPTKLISNTRIKSQGTEMKFRKMAEDMQKALDEMERMYKRYDMETRSEDTTKQGEIQESIDKIDLIKNATVTINERGIKVTLGNQMLFASGRSELKPQAKLLLDRIIKELHGIDNKIIVEGHTDNIPISTAQFPSNWELSTNRAVNVLKYLINEDPTLIGKISAAGYADTSPIATNDTVDGRQKNRRVDIIILKSIDEMVNEKMTNDRIMNEITEEGVR